MNTRYIYTFGIIMTFVVAVLLAGLRTVLKDQIAKNEEVFNKRAVLEAVSKPIVDAGQMAVADMSDD
ncbi:MAG: NADH:ubiquinone reductase (Na(+)-transporting) subunit C, partial [Bacteroidota bacterium]